MLWKILDSMKYKHLLIGLCANLDFFKIYIHIEIYIICMYKEITKL